MNDISKKFSLETTEQLRMMNKELKIGQVFGTWIVCEEIVPHTDLDRLEENGLIFAPTQAKEAATPTSSNGIVLQTGPDCKNVEPGMVVAFGRHAGRTIQIGDGEKDKTRLHRILEEKEICFTWEVSDGTDIELQVQRKATRKKDAPAARTKGLV